MLRLATVGQCVVDVSGQSAHVGLITFAVGRILASEARNMTVYTKVLRLCHRDAPHRDMELSQFAQVHHMAALQFVTDGVIEFRQHQPHIGGFGRAVGLYLLFNLIERYFAAFHGVCKKLAIVFVASDFVSNQSEMYCHDIKIIKLIKKMLCVCFGCKGNSLI